jgi:hypothetical protein
MGGGYLVAATPVQMSVFFLEDSPANLVPHWSVACTNTDTTGTTGLGQVCSCQWKDRV